MKISVDEGTIKQLSDGVSTWERQKARSEEEQWGYDKFEEAMNKYDDVLTWARTEHGMQKIGEGRDRMTFTGGSVVAGEKSVVIKISRSDGMMQNRDEIEIWQQLDDSAREHVAPIITWADDYSWIIQRRASQGAPPGASKTVAERLDEAGWTCSDIRPDNVGLIDGEPVLMDLGIGLREV